jgi:hypothetical protein
VPALSDEKIAAAAYAAGFRNEDLDIAIAIALAESGGDPRAHNTKPPDNSYGLWQINMIGSLGPARRRDYGISSNDELFDPYANARAAFQVSGGNWGKRDWTPWSVYKSGAYEDFLPRAGKIGKGLVDTIRGVPGAVTGGVSNVVTDALGDMAEPFLNGLRRIAIIGVAIGGGIALVVLGGWRGVKAGG